eukprot:CAMPEP_0182594608 /NCGR_PEP_ID=MMETSP1324-20130603/80525_1 /TAXON_ID=236786 /ORGANISM="Florenciella sp., Strain RCC1587" /LENGTH=62 /DNA_ID=CAMNT_0024812165 /DNA_START=79 /DNA_END=263 /DNA_ORIENTATION=-
MRVGTTLTGSAGASSPSGTLSFFTTGAGAAGFGSSTAFSFFFFGFTVLPSAPTVAHPSSAGG